MEQTKGMEEVRHLLEGNLQNWEVRDDQLYRRYDTANWRVTLMTANAIGFLAEAAYHHPRLILNYLSVEVFLTTHDAGGLTQKDFDLAKIVEETILWPRREAGTPRMRPKDWLSE